MRQDGIPTLFNFEYFQSVMARLDPGLSKWKGFVLRCRNVAQLSLIKMDLEVRTEGSGNVDYKK